MPIWRDIPLQIDSKGNIDLSNFGIELNRRLKYYLANIDVTQILYNLNDIGGTLILSKGGTGTSLSAPASDRIMFYDLSGNKVEWLELGTGLSITDKTINLPQNISTSSDVTFDDITGTGKVKGATGHFGGNTDYSSFETDGTLVFNGNASVWDDLRIEPTVRSTGTGVPVFEKWFDNGSGSNGIFLFSFTDEHVNEKEIHFTAQMPHAWKGTAIGIHVHWIPKTSQSSKKVKWGLEYNWSEIGATFGNTTIVYKDINIQGDTSLVQNKHYITAFDAITPSVNQDGISSVLIGRLFRNTTDTTNDSYTDKAGLLYIDIHYEIDTLGSRSEYSK